MKFLDFYGLNIIVRTLNATYMGTFAEYQEESRFSPHGFLVLYPATRITKEPASWWKFLADGSVEGGLFDTEPEPVHLNLAHIVEFRLIDLKT